MTQFHINRSIETPKGSLTKFVKAFDSIEDALDELYRQAKRHGYEVTIDNTIPASLGFCLWQIQVVVGKWRYFVTEESEDTLALMGF
jgi:hypothetical protein